MKQQLNRADECLTPRDEIAKAASLWYSFIADLLTDLTSKFSALPVQTVTPLTTASTSIVMAIPVHILYTIRISTIQKFSAGIVFTVGIITMIVCIVRVITLSLSFKKGAVTTLWSVVEAGVCKTASPLFLMDSTDFVGSDSNYRWVSTLLRNLHQGPCRSLSGTIL
jgi:hypothetical protein